jgi:hypothetical protein
MAALPEFRSPTPILESGIGRSLTTIRQLFLPIVSRERLEPLLLSICALLVAMLMFGAFMALQGIAPLELYTALYVGSLEQGFRSRTH